MTKSRFNQTLRKIEEDLGVYWICPTCRKKIEGDDRIEEKRMAKRNRELENEIEELKAKSNDKETELKLRINENEETKKQLENEIAK